MATPPELWRRYEERLVSAAGVTLDLSRLSLPADFEPARAADVKRAFAAMRDLEAGGIANPSEGRMAGHYWLRDPGVAPEEKQGQKIREAIEGTLRSVKAFAADVHAGRIRPQRAGLFRNVLVVGIGGSALGPQLVADALSPGGDRMRLWFFDNTDPEGMDRTLFAIAAAGEGLPATLTIVISKSGTTKETKNGLLEAREAYRRAGLAFPRHAVAVTGETRSELKETAEAEGWIARFPMWDWVGGRTSVTSAVGVLPALLQGLDADGILEGAREMDRATRNEDARANPAMRLALAWHHATGGAGKKDMVILPYKDRLILLPRYLQQLVMESLGKEKDLDGNVVHQGITVYGNKGSTDQHSYVQQLRDGVHNFFVTFIQVLQDRGGPSLDLGGGVTGGDYLLGFLLGTRQALFEKDRESITITIDQVTPRSLGALIALFERAVGFYAVFINVNAYDQPGVEAGKKAAERAIELQRKVLAALRAAKGKLHTAASIAEIVQAPDEVETVFHLLEHLAANGRNVRQEAGAGPGSHGFASVD